MSAVTLELTPDSLARGPGAARDLIYAALEAGVNTFHMSSPDAVLAEVVGEALTAIDRKLVCVSLAVGRQVSRRGDIRDFSPEGLTGAIDQALNLSGLGWLDIAMLDAPGIEELPQAALSAVKAQRSAGRIKLLGVSGDHDAMDAYISTNAFDVIALPFHVNSTWATRARMRAALERDMAVIGYGFYPAELARPKMAETLLKGRKGLFGMASRPTDPNPAKAGAFAFLHETPNWSAEEICLAFALTDPTVSTVMIEADAADRLNALAATPDRDLPPGLAAMVEMARVRAAA